jgi:hypothetical protein
MLKVRATKGAGLEIRRDIVPSLTFCTAMLTRMGSSPFFSCLIDHNITIYYPTSTFTRADMFLCHTRPHGEPPI